MENNQDQPRDDKENTSVQICGKRSLSRSGLDAEPTALPSKRSDQKCNDLSQSNEEAVNELLILMQEKRENEIDLDRLSEYSKINPAQIPILHPKLVKVDDFYQGGAKLKDNQLHVDHQFSVDQLLSPDNTNRLQCLVGSPGVGKSTLSKRLVKNSAYKLSLHFEFSEFNHHNVLTLQEFLLDKKFDKFGFPPEKCQKVFSWILANQSKCFLVMDGLDQAQFALSDEPADENHCEPLSVSTIIACLFKKIFLPRVRIIVTSRPHALLLLHHSLRPDIIYQVQGLSHEDARTLLECLAGDRFEELSLKLKQLGRAMEDMCKCPLLLQMFVLSQVNPSKSIGDATTITRIVATIVENLHRSKNSRTNFHNVHAKLARLAYNTFATKQMMISWDEVQKEGLGEHEIHDLIVTVPGNESASDKVMYFIHKLFHEYFCAWHVCNLTDYDFQRFLEDIKENYNFSAVKKFVFGLVYDINKGQKGMENKHMGLEAYMVSEIKVESVLSFALESKDQDVLSKAADALIHFVYISDEYPSTREVLKHVKRQIKYLVVSGNKHFLSTLSAIGQMPGTVKTLKIDPDHLSELPNDVIDQFLPKVDKRLEVQRSSLPSNPLGYDEKLGYLQKSAASLGRPDIDAIELSDFEYYFDAGSDNDSSDDSESETDGSDPDGVEVDGLEADD